MSECNYVIKIIETYIRDLIKNKLEKVNIDYNFLNSGIKSSNCSIFRKKEEYNNYKENLYFKIEREKKIVKLFLSLKFNKKDEYFLYLTSFNINTKTNNIEKEIKKFLERIKEYNGNNNLKSFIAYEFKFSLDDVDKIVIELVKRKLVEFLNINNNVKF